jgi:hypothetical protein
LAVYLDLPKVSVRHFVAAFGSVGSHFSQIVSPFGLMTQPTAQPPNCLVPGHRPLARVQHFSFLSSSTTLTRSSSVMLVKKGQPKYRGSNEWLLKGGGCGVAADYG